MMRGAGVARERGTAKATIAACWKYSTSLLAGTTRRVMLMPRDPHKRGTFVLYAMWKELLLRGAARTTRRSWTAMSGPHHR
jgi:hypothetical protein